MLSVRAFSPAPVPAWALRRPKPWLQALYDLSGAPLRMVALPDAASERLHLTSLRAERFAAVLPALRGRVLDVGAGDNALLRVYRQRAAALGVDAAAADASLGVDVVDWNAGCTLIRDAASLPFEDASFDTVSFIACLNHIPNRRAALHEAHRVLKPGGRAVVTMISRLVGTIGHAIWWYSEDKHRDVKADELMGMADDEVVGALRDAGFGDVSIERFAYGLNRLYVAPR